ncbi:MAG: hypothetical protein EBZ78_02240 [Verrucomicrobia bacterium]|nr:hypothetical protein [Verrucomicrobiota bacterium]
MKTETGSKIIYLNPDRAMDFTDNEVLHDAVTQRARKVLDPLANSEIARLEEVVASLKKAVNELQDLRVEVASYREVTVKLACELGMIQKTGLFKNPGSSQAHNVILAASSAFGVSTQKLLGKERPDYIAHPRMAAMWVLRTKLGMPLTEVGALFGRDHGTVLHACNRVPAMMKKNKVFAENVMKVLNTFNWEQESK